MPKMKRRSQKLQLINFKAEPELIQWVRSYATANDTYVSEVIRFALERLKEDEQKVEHREAGK